MQRPQVVLVNPLDPMRYDLDRDAVAHVLKTDYGLYVASYSNFVDFEKDLKNQKVALDKLMFMAVQEHDWSSFGKNSVTLQNGLMKSYNEPIILITPSDDEDNPRVNSTVLEYGQARLLRVESLADIVDILSRESQILQQKSTIRSLAEEMHWFQFAYDKNYTGLDDNTLGVQDFNGKIVAEFIRCHLLPGLLVKQEYDDVLPRKMIFMEQKGNDYMKYLLKLKNLKPTEREQLALNLERILGIVRHTDGGLIYTESSFGHDVAGYAIDAVSLEDAITIGKGAHNLAGDILRHKLEYIEYLRKKKNPEYSSRPKIIRGLVYLEIEGYGVPIVEIKIGQNDEIIRRVGTHIIQQRKMLPIDAHANLIDGNYTSPRIIV